MPPRCAAARRYLSYFAAHHARLGSRTQRLRARPRAPAHLIPDNRKRVYDVRAVIDALCGETLELRRGFAPGMVTALARHEGRPFGVIANDPSHLGGAIDADGADKAARFMQLCDAFALPLLFLCDTPGFMVGPEAERTATVRHFSRMFVTGANLQVPTGTIVLRKGYGLGAQAMAAGGFKAPLFTVGWPTSEFGGMGLEGAVRLGMRRELEAIADPEQRQASVRPLRRRRLRTRPRDQHGGVLRDRRRDRSRRQPAAGSHRCSSPRRRAGGSSPASAGPISTPGRRISARRLLTAAASCTARKRRATSRRGSPPGPRGALTPA